ncbi:asparaginase [Modestobacter sp. DSM 44400]|uniref:asparaginase n=1 Tax=Modestobacter sp. DSM 44400 TaxID=1550230 RepID=UPI0011152E24|nr:asparaginase [Modestobacter sp. DSM 44400]
MTRPLRIVLLATGGTIACTTTTGVAVKTLRAADLLATVPALPGVEVQGSDFGLTSSWDLTPPTMLEVAHRVEELLVEHDAVVVSQGTDTLEETAALLSFAVRSPRPVVVTGAMRASDEPGADGARNLQAALLVAAHPDAAGRGALVVLDDDVHRAVTVTKRHSSTTSTFGSPNAGPVGLVHGDRVIFVAPPSPLTRYDVVHAAADVPLLVVAAGAPRRVLEAAVAGADGLVVARFGLGHAPAAWMPVLGAAVDAGMPVVMASRTGAGPVGGRYAGPGGDLDVADRGLLSAGLRSPATARIELICALGAGADPVEAFARTLP